MGEKGNITSEELAVSAAATGGAGAVVAGAGTQVTAVFEQAGETLKDKVIDKGADAGISAASDKWKDRHADEQPDVDPPPDRS